MREHPPARFPHFVRYASFFAANNLAILAKQTATRVEPGRRHPFNFVS